MARATTVAWPQGDSTPVRIPDPNQYGKFIIVDRIQGQQGLPQMTVEFRTLRDLSSILALIRKGCPADVQLHIGACKDPSDFNKGWEKIVVLEGAKATDYGTSDLGALDADQNAPIQETVPFTGLDYYELAPIAGSEVAASQIVQRVIDVVICDSKQCGECGIPSDGCQKIFALTLSVGGSPGLPAEILFSPNGGLTWDDTNVTTLGANEDPDAMACVGTYLVVVSEDDEAYHYAPIADILLSLETWTRVTTGITALKGLKDLFSLGRTMTWFVAEGGYIYFSSDITAGVSVQTDGSVTVQDLNAIHGIDELNLVAVGALNAMLVTSNGGETWQSVTGPAVGVALNTIFMKSESEWFVGDAGGNLWYTRNAGATWVAKAFSGSGSGAVTDISFPTPTVGYMSHNSTTPRGRIFRSIDGGYSWYALPEAPGLSLPNGDSFDAIAACGEDPNLVFAGGLGDNAVDGILVKIS